MFIKITHKQSNEQMLYNTDVIKYIVKDPTGGCLLHCFEHNDRNPPEYVVSIQEDYEQLKDIVINNFKR